MSIISIPHGLVLQIVQEISEDLELLEVTGTVLMGVFAFYIKQHSRLHTSKVSSRLRDAHKEVRHDFRRPQEEVYRLSCDVPAPSSEKGGERTIFDSKLCVEM